MDPSERTRAGDIRGLRVAWRRKPVLMCCGGSVGSLAVESRLRHSLVDIDFECSRQDRSWYKSLLGGP